jgi:hypothetical protein
MDGWMDGWTHVFVCILCAVACASMLWMSPGACWYRLKLPLIDARHSAPFCWGQSTVQESSENKNVSHRKILGESIACTGVPTVHKKECRQSIKRSADSP